MMRWLTLATFVFANAALPLFPSFIMLTNVEPPGVALIPVGASACMLAICVVLALGLFVRLLIPPYVKMPTLLPLLAWLGAGVLSALLGFDPRAGAVFILIFGLGIVWHLAILRFYRDPFVVTAMVWTMMLACACASLTAIVMVVLRRPVAQYVIGHSRAIGTFVLPGELAGYLVVLLPIAYGIAMTTKSVALRWCALTAIATGAIAFVLTFSRAGWVGLAAAVGFIVAMRVRAWHGMLAAAGIVAAGLVAVLLVFNVAHNPSENYTRLSIWQAAVQIINRFPLTGVGPFEFSRLYAVVRAPDGDATAFHAHSVYLTLLAEIGVIGVAAATWTWWRFARELWRRIATDDRHALLALAVSAGLVGTLVQGLIDTVSIVLFGLWLPTMAFALAAARDGLAESNA